MAKASLGASLQELRGEIGNEIFTKGRSGPVVRAPAKYKFKLTPAMANFRRCLQAGDRDCSMNLRARRWKRGTLLLERKSATTLVNGNRYAPTGHNLYMGLTCKFLQIHPGAVPPVDPPAGSFAGDKIVVTAELFGGSLTFFGSGANADNAMTELLLQKIAFPPAPAHR